MVMGLHEGNREKLQHAAHAIRQSTSSVKALKELDALKLLLFVTLM